MSVGGALITDTKELFTRGNVYDKMSEKRSGPRHWNFTFNSGKCEDAPMSVRCESSSKKTSDFFQLEVTNESL